MIKYNMKLSLEALRQFVRNDHDNSSLLSLLPQEVYALIQQYFIHAAHTSYDIKYYSEPRYLSLEDQSSIEDKTQMCLTHGNLVSKEVITIPSRPEKKILEDKSIVKIMVERSHDPNNLFKQPQQSLSTSFNDDAVDQQHSWTPK